MALQKRTIKAIRNIVAATILKGLSILISLILVPLTLSYLNQYEYGIWLTLSSVLSWVYLFDIGLGNGLRNKLTEALALNNIKLAKVYVSTSFYSLLIIVVGIYAIFLLLQSFIDWYTILNVDQEKVSNLSSIVIIVFAFFCTSFVLKIIGNIYMAYQQSAINDLFTFLGNAVSLILIYICTLLVEKGSLEQVAVIYSAAPVIVYFIAFPITFIKLKDIKPSIRCVKFVYLRELMSLGMQFFIIQIACLVLFMTSNLIISRMFGPELVTPYNIAYKYFSLISTGFTIVITPIWSAVTDAYVCKDYSWIRHTMNKLLLLWALSVTLSVVMVIVSNCFYKFWVGNEVAIPYSLSVLCAAYVCILNWNNIFNYFLNGVGKIRLQLYATLLVSIVFLPLAFIMGKNMGVNGVILALCICMLCNSVWAPIQYRKIINIKDSGIWSK